VGHGIGIRMAYQAGMIRDVDPSQNQVTILGEAM